jgi:hypothetical protein
MGLSAPGVIVVPWFLILMAINTPVQIRMASLAIILTIIEFVSVFLYPARIIMFDPPVFMIKRHAILFNVLMTNITRNFFFASFFVTWNAATEHIRDKIQGNSITLLNTLMALIACDIIFKMNLMGKL